jgi:hypothetical protein
MSTQPAASQVLGQEFLVLRSKLIDVAAILDRLDRAKGAELLVADDPRIQAIRRSWEILAGDVSDRAERIQRLFSLPYDEKWRET